MSNVTECRKAAQCGVLVLCTLFLVAHPTKTQAQAAPVPVQTLVEVRTELGTIILALFNETPQHRDNFLKLVREGAYDSLLFHRVVRDLIVQGGDPRSKRVAPGAPLAEGVPDQTIAAEIVPGLIHKKGALAAARQADPDNPDRKSGGSQFYIVQGKTFTTAELERVQQRNARFGTQVIYTEEQKKTYATLGGAPHLDGAYTIFGEVVEGQEVIDAIAAQPCDAHDRPLKDIRMFMHVRE